MKFLLISLFIFSFSLLSSCFIGEDRKLPSREGRKRLGPRGKAPRPSDLSPSQTENNEGESLTPPGQTPTPSPSGLNPQQQEEGFPDFDIVPDLQHTSLSLSLTPGAAPLTKVTFLASPQEHPLKLAAMQSGNVLNIETSGEDKIISISLPISKKTLFLELKTAMTDWSKVFVGKTLSKGDEIVKTKSAFAYSIKDEHQNLVNLCIGIAQNPQNIKIIKNYDDSEACN